MSFYYEVAPLKSPLDPLVYKTEEILKVGQKVLIALRKREIYGVIIKTSSKPIFKCENIESKSEYFYSSMMMEIASFISKYYVCSIGEALGVFVPFFEIKKNEQQHEFYDNIILSKKQNEAYSFLQQNKIALLFANTGSGKTEIYIKCILQVLSENKQAVLLMPEIALTPQMKERLEKIFYGNIAIWHSKITKKQKSEIITGVLAGRINVIAGARSALFLPYAHLGLIVVDEEHDDSYKSDQKPRYNAKDLSLYIGKKFGIQIILGSATPSINSFVKIPFFRLDETFYNTRKQYSYDENVLGLTPQIQNALQNRLSKNEQTIIFLPTRANFKYQICNYCGKSLECPFCSVSLSLHRNNRSLECHYCNYTQQIIEVCPSCNYGVLKNYRLGTQELYEKLTCIFKDANIEIFDKDSMKTTSKLNKTLKAFNQNEIDILIGTQMLSKGHDYHNVTLAIIMGIDALLQMSSYKVREKTLALALQISGRSGRNGYGEVLIQTKNKDFFIEYIQNKDYQDFLEEELIMRKPLYPPYVKIAKVVFSDKNGLKAKEIMEEYAINATKFSGIELVGAKESTIFKVANKYRYEIIIRSADIQKLLSFLHSIRTPIAMVDMDTLH